jgi:16S rRNA (cytosine967-C5)-methyltransferase
VQDLGAQQAAVLLDPAPGSRVLDACAAPGGKTAHLLERADLELTALDIDPLRCRRIAANLARLGLAARVRCGDASRPAAWGRAPAEFDAILADVPCSASGVVRRHPDAKWLRRPEDVLRFAALQRRILERLWTALRPGGKLLYATCSVFPEENHTQIEKFRARHPEARLIDSVQWLPDAEHDGFYYALLDKPASA